MGHTSLHTQPLHAVLEIALLYHRSLLILEFGGQPILHTLKQRIIDRSCRGALHGDAEDPMGAGLILDGRVQHLLKVGLADESRC